MARHSRFLWLLLGAAGALSSSRTDAHEGWGIVVDSSGQVTFSDIPTNRTWRLSRDGEVEQVASGKHSHALVLDPAGNLYGTNPHLTLPIRSVWRLAPDGYLADVIPPTQNLPLGLQSFIRDDAGNIYSVSARTAGSPELLLLKRSPEGEITALAGSTVGHADGIGSQAKFLGIDGMAWGPDGALYVTDGPYARRIALDGTVTTIGGGPLTERKWDEDLLGIAVNEGGVVYVADHASRRVRKIAHDGSVSTVLSTGSVWAPTGIALARDGLYLLQHLRMPLAILGDLAVGPYLRVVKVTADGKVTVLTRLWGRRTGAAAVAVVVVVVVVGVILGAKLLRARRKSD